MKFSDSSIDSPAANGVVDEGIVPGRVSRLLGGAIRRLRTQRGWTLEMLSERADISRQHVSEIERGARSFSVTTLERIAAGLGTTVLKVVEIAYEGES